MPQVREDIAQVSQGINAATAAAFDHGVDDRTAFSDPGVADEEPAFFFTMNEQTGAQGEPADGPDTMTGAIAER